LKISNIQLLQEGAKMDSKKLTYIQTIAEEGNITKAAKKLYLSQPALTIFLNKLESQLGIKLFDRNRSPIQLTYAGERYLTEMKKAVQIEQALYREFEEIAQNRKGRLIIGIGNARGDYWLPFIIPEFMKRFPGVSIKVVEGKSSSFEEELVNGQIDLAITALPIFSPDIEYEIISEEVIFLAVNQGNPILEGLDLTGNSLHNLLRIDPKRLDGQKFLCPSPGHGLYRCTMQLFEKHGIHPGQLEEINNSDTAYHLACNGFGLVFTPDTSATPPYPAVQPVFCTLDDPPYTRKIVAAYCKYIGCSPIAQNFIDVARTVVSTCPALQIPDIPL